jgi:hypothetical protein
MSMTAITLAAPERPSMMGSAGGSAADVGLWKLSCTLARWRDRRGGVKDVALHLECDEGIDDGW